MSDSSKEILKRIPLNGIPLKELYHETIDCVKSVHCWGLYYESLKKSGHIKEYNCPRNGTSVKRIK